MNLRQLATFRTASRTLSFTRTAEIHSYAQSSVSTQIGQLETELGGPLFNRIGRKLTLTAKGQQLLTYANRILDLADEALLTVTNEDEPSGQLTIAAPETLCAYRLPPVIQRFRALYPSVNMRILPTPEGPEAWQQMLHNGEVEAAMRIGAELVSAEFHIQSLNAEPLHLVVHPEHPLAHKSAIRPSDLAGETMLLTESTCTYRVIFEQQMLLHGATPHTRIEFHAVEAIKQCAIAGLGVALLPEITIAAALRTNQLTTLTWQDPVIADAHRVTTQIMHPKRPLSANLKAFLRILCSDET